MKNSISHNLKSFLIILFSLLFFYNPVHAETEWDWEVRCCFSEDDIRDVFLISLSPLLKPVAEMKLETPDGRTYGYEEKSKRFYPPSYNIIYASLEHSMPIKMSEWNHFRDRRFVVNNVREGNYRVSVYGIRDGRYSLTFRRKGAYRVGPSIKMSGDDELFSSTIKKGEIHIYRLSGIPKYASESSSVAKTFSSFDAVRIK